MQKALTELLSLLSAALRWWLGELAALVPRQLRQGLRSARGTVVLALTDRKARLSYCRVGGASRSLGTIDLERGDLPFRRAALARTLQPLAHHRFDVAVSLSPMDGLRKTVSLPVAAAEDLRQAISFQLERHTPFTPEEAYFDYRILERDEASRRLKVQLTVAGRAVVDEAVRVVTELGLPPDVVYVASDDGQGPPSGNLLPLLDRAERSRGRGTISVILGCLAVFLAIVAVYIPLDQERAIADDLTQRLMEARKQAETAARSQKEIDALIGDSQFLSRRKRLGPTASDIVFELTRLIPDDTWLVQLQSSGNEVQITGFSASASSLIGLFERSELFRKTEFRSPVTQDSRSGRERFHISAQVVREGGP